MKRYEIRYKMVGEDTERLTVMITDDVNQAQMLWDSIMYLRSIYQMPLSRRPV